MTKYVLGASKWKALCLQEHQKITAWITSTSLSTAILCFTAFIPLGRSIGHRCPSLKSPLSCARKESLFDQIVTDQISLIHSRSLCVYMFSLIWVGAGWKTFSVIVKGHGLVWWRNGQKMPEVLCKTSKKPKADKAHSTLVVSSLCIDAIAWFWSLYVFNNS